MDTLQPNQPKGREPVQDSSHDKEGPPSSGHYRPRFVSLDNGRNSNHQSYDLEAEQLPNIEEDAADKLLVWGGRPLAGTVEVSGSKNASLALLAASLLVEGVTVLRNVPMIDDVRTMIAVLREMGAKVHTSAAQVVTIDATHLTSYSAPYELVRRMRASFYAAGALLGRLKRAEVALPGGCYIGARPVNFHLEGFKKLGARVRLEYGQVLAEATRLTGTTLTLDSRFRSVGATINLMLVASHAEGLTVMENASRDPDAVECARFLNAAGACIQGADTSTLTISGVKSLHSVEYSVIPDRVEAGTLLIAGAATRGDVTVHPAVPPHLSALTDALRRAGASFEVGADWVRVTAVGSLHPFDIVTAPFPGFPTDLQPPCAALMCTCDGESKIVETIFEGRLKHVGELRRMGANITVVGPTAYIDGGGRLTGAPVEAQDLRAGAALLVGGLVSDGRTEISGAHVLDRGYESLEEKLRGLGAVLTRPSRAVRRTRHAAAGL